MRTLARHRAPYCRPLTRQLITKALNPYRVTEGLADADFCCDECRRIGARLVYRCYYDGNDEADALAAFYAAEEQLLKGEL